MHGYSPRESVFMDLAEHIKKFAVPSIRLKSTQKEALLNWLDTESATNEEEATEEAAKQRKYPRIPFKQLTEIIILIRPQGGTIMTFRVPSRALSSGGVGFLHGSFIYPNTACLVILTTLDGTLTKVTGQVKHCEYISGQVHGIGVEFDSPIDVGQYIELPLADLEMDQPQVTAANE